MASEVISKISAQKPVRWMTLLSGTRAEALGVEIIDRDGDRHEQEGQRGDPHRDSRPAASRQTCQGAFGRDSAAPRA